MSIVSPLTWSLSAINSADYTFSLSAADFEKLMNQDPVNYLKSLG